MNHDELTEKARKDADAYLQTRLEKRDEVMRMVHQTMENETKNKQYYGWITFDAGQSGDKICRAMIIYIHSTVKVMVSQVHPYTEQMDDTCTLSLVW